MKFIATLLIAAVFASAVMADEEAPARGFKAAIAAKAKELKAKLNQAISAGKIKAGELYKQHGPTKEQALAKFDELKGQFGDQIKQYLIEQAKQQAAQKMSEQLIKAIMGNDAAKV